MSLVLPTLLYLGLYLGQSMQAQRGNLTQPILIAKPASTLRSKESVTIQCHGPLEAEAYKVFKEGGPEPKVTKEPSLYIQEMKTDQAGLHRCSYQRGEHWSQPSDPLTLIMTGSYDKPSLSSTQASVVASGDKVVLKCFSKLKFHRFILTKEDGVSAIQNQNSTSQDGQCQAVFHVTHTQTGAYRCYGVFNDNPYLWSDPSDPLELVVKDVLDSSTRPTEPGSTQDLPQNLAFLIGLPVAILLVLLILLLFFLCRRKAKNKAAKTGRHPEAVELVNRQASEARDPQDVTYLQVAFNVPTQGTFSTPRQTQASDYATVAPR